MSPARHRPVSFPERIHIIGGGLWARVIAGELCKIVPPEYGIEMHSAHGAAGLRDWAGRQALTTRVQASSEWPSLVPPRSAAFIVANATRDHAAALERLLDAQPPALVEKPFALTGEDTRRLVYRARELQAPIAASHVFLFARYLQRFTEIIAETGPVERISIVWCDPTAEVRHGERKNFDAGVALPVDVLPHISSLIGSILPEASQSCHSVRVARGGAAVELELFADEIPCQVSLERNGQTRKRALLVYTPSGNLVLDFASEPVVTIRSGCQDRRLDPDPLWGKADGPLASMLRTFLFEAATGRDFDARLSLSLTLRESNLADQVTAVYSENVRAWLIDAARKGKPADEDGLRYALREHLLSTRRLDPRTEESRVTEILAACRGLQAADVEDLLNQV